MRRGAVSWFVSILLMLVAVECSTVFKDDGKWWPCGVDAHDGELRFWCGEP